MNVIKRNGSKQEVSFDKVVWRLKSLCDIVPRIKNIDTSNHFYRIKNATHAMILTHHAWFNKNLPNIIEK